MKFFEQELHRQSVALDEHQKSMGRVNLLVFELGDLNNITHLLMDFSRQGTVWRPVLQFRNDRQNDNM
jgi:hypothetical protein